MGLLLFSPYSGVLVSSAAVAEANDIDNTVPGDFVLWTAQTIYYTRVVSGNWSDVTTWSTGGCGGTAASAIPTSVDVVYICPGNTVTVNGTYGCGVDCEKSQSSKRAHGTFHLEKSAGR